MVRKLFVESGYRARLRLSLSVESRYLSEPEVAALLQASVKAGFLKEEKVPGGTHHGRNPTSWRTAAKPLIRRTADFLRVVRYGNFINGRPIQRVGDYALV